MQCWAWFVRRFCGFQNINTTSLIWRLSSKWPQIYIANYCVLSIVNIVISLWPNDTIWRHRFLSILAQIMACCLTAPSHYLNQCWFIISNLLWHSSESIIIQRSQYTNQINKNENRIFKITSKSPGANELNKKWCLPPPSNCSSVVSHTLLPKPGGINYVTDHFC